MLGLFRVSGLWMIAMLLACFFLFLPSEAFGQCANCGSAGRAVRQMPVSNHLMTVTTMQAAPVMRQRTIVEQVPAVQERTIIERTPIVQERERVVVEQVPTVMAVPTYSMQRSMSYSMMSSGYGMMAMRAPAPRRGVGLGLFIGARGRGAGW